MLESSARYTPDISSGLTSEQVQKRIEENLCNRESKSNTKTSGQIIRQNLFTLFNFVNVFLALCILLVGSYKNLLFMGVILCNTAIGIIQEIRAKKAMERLSILSAAKVSAIRNGSIQLLDPEDLVLDDLLQLSSGSQIPADCVIRSGECEVNESLLTGESDAVAKKEGDSLLSGSFLVSGTCLAQVMHIGDDNYASSITNNAKYIKAVRSEIMQALNSIIRVISMILLPLGALLFYRQLQLDGNSLQTAVVSTAAALIGMIPEGLVLLTSTVMAVGVVRLSKRKVLIQELYCMETLARVDVLCLDKTGTLTEGRMEIENLYPLPPYTSANASQAFAALVHCLNDTNPTFTAVRDYFGSECSWSPSQIIPFSSQRKWSGVSFGEQGTYVMGAAEFILRGKMNQLTSAFQQIPAGRRILTLAYSPLPFSGKNLPENLEPVAVLAIRDVIRKEAPATIEYFRAQGVELKVISGDNPETAAAVAQAAGMDISGGAVDTSTLSTPEEIFQAAKTYSVFGRVSPAQKHLLIQSLKKQGHTVAMTGDGVNDVLALKEADCSIAMASGSEAARTVSQLILLDSNFASMPKIVAEGRRSINNIQRSASLFLVKTIYSALLAFLFLFITMPYPFQPIQMTLISVFTIGIPSFVLALEPNRDRVKGSFIRNVLSPSAPGALTIVSEILLTMVVSHWLSFSPLQTSTLAVALTAFIGWLILLKICLPLNPLRITLLLLMFSGICGGIFLFSGVFSLVPFTLSMALTWALLAAASALLFCLYSTAGRRIKVKGFPFHRFSRK